MLVEESQASRQGVEKLTVLQMHLDRWSVGCFAHPDIEIFSLARLEKQHVVAIVQLGQLVELIQLAFRVEFGILATMREEGVEIVEKMALAFRGMKVEVRRLIS